MKAVILPCTDCHTAIPPHRFPDYIEAAAGEFSQPIGGESIGTRILLDWMTNLVLRDGWDRQSMSRAYRIPR